MSNEQIWTTPSEADPSNLLCARQFGLRFIIIQKRSIPWSKTRRCKDTHPNTSDIKTRRWRIKTILSLLLISDELLIFKKNPKLVRYLCGSINSCTCGYPFGKKSQSSSQGFWKGKKERLCFTLLLLALHCVVWLRLLFWIREISARQEILTIVIRDLAKEKKALLCFASLALSNFDHFCAVVRNPSGRKSSLHILCLEFRLESLSLTWSPSQLCPLSRRRFRGNKRNWQSWTRGRDPCLNADIIKVNQNLHLVLTIELY